MLAEGGSACNDWCPFKKNMWTWIYRGEGHVGTEAATGMVGTSTSQEGQGSLQPREAGKRKQDSSLPCQHLHFRLLASRAAREQIPIL